MLAKLELATQLAIGILFLFSAVGKLWDRRGFAEGVGQYRLLPPAFVKPFSFVVILVEILLAFTHLTGTFLRIAFPIGVLTLVSFGVAVSVNLKRGRALPCYCFGHGGEGISTSTLARLALLTVGETLLLATHGVATAPLLRSTFELGAGVFWAVTLLAGGSWLLSLGDLLQLFRPLRTASVAAPAGSPTEAVSADS
jgi:Methylamine utilisation protein MauE